MFVCWRENKRRDALDTAAGEAVHHDTDFRDLTDVQNVVRFPPLSPYMLLWLFKIRMLT